MDNYRPISVLPVASKILERAVQIQLLQHLDKSSQLSPFQCGFRKNHSTQDTVTYIRLYIVSERPNTGLKGQNRAKRDKRRQTDHF